MVPTSPCDPARALGFPHIYVNIRNIAAHLHIAPIQAVFFLHARVSLQLASVNPCHDGAISIMMEVKHTTNPWGGHSYVSTEPEAIHPHLGANKSGCPSFRSSVRTSLLDVGILKSTLLPSLALHSGLAGIAYTAGRLTDRIEAKDIIWPLGPVVNAWWSSVFRHSFFAGPHGVSIGTAFGALSRPEKLILTGVTLWGGRLFYRILSRAMKRGVGRDNPMYETMKKQHGFSWNRALYKIFLPEVLFQSIISLPFTAPFRLGYYSGAIMKGSYHALGQGVAVGLFTAGLVMECLADFQLEEFKHRRPENGHQAGEKICKGGVWGIVRHPNYLGDALVHMSFPLMLYASDMLAPIALFGPLANYLFLRYVGGDKTDEYSRTRRYSSSDVGKKIEFDRYRRERNSFWPDKSSLTNKWTWIVVGCGIAGAALERVVMGVV
ncbi:hypothetical protein QBC35DRAFT_508785 [Podospora australis]|uniref:Steroid 5-alpha reductase C-terminal domain-containing protein n=1 Tax=Podospora australis TaxID=1536484 RepID=A0AAN6WMX0_9PEZI|nr:hypothetical protein QBC35DRAFT_508785 [Podospora australis]